jgi:hypothetical protein
MLWASPTSGIGRGVTSTLSRWSRLSHSVWLVVERDLDFLAKTACQLLVPSSSGQLSSCYTTEMQVNGQIWRTLGDPTY